MTAAKLIREAMERDETSAAGCKGSAHALRYAWVRVREHDHAASVLRDLLSAIETAGDGGEVESACSFLRGLSESPDAAHRQIARYYPDRYEDEVAMLLQTARDLGWQPPPAEAERASLPVDGTKGTK